MRSQAVVSAGSDPFVASGPLTSMISASSGSDTGDEDTFTSAVKPGSRVNASVPSGESCQVGGGGAGPWASAPR